MSTTVKSSGTITVKNSLVTTSNINFSNKGF